MKRLTLAAVLTTLLMLSSAAITASGRADKVGGAQVEMTSVIVTLRERANVRPPVSGRAARRRTVILALRGTADRSQVGLKTLLDARRRQGKVARVTPFWVFNGLAVRATPAVIAELARRPEVLRITPDESILAPPVPSDTAPAEPNVDLVNAPAMWARGFRGQGAVVANLDTGVDATHPDLADRWRGGANSWFDPSGEHAAPFDASGHGTWTMGVIVGGDAGGSAVGIAPGAQWIAVKIFNDSGTATTSRIHQGFQWLLDPDGNPSTDDAPSVVNSSWSLSAPGCDLEFQDDLQSLRAADILPVFAGGNYGPTASTSVSPANNPEAFAVGATTVADTIWSQSSRGPSACIQPETVYPELVAPGVNVRTTDLFGLYRSETGTSIAAPHATGALALLLSAFPVSRPTGRRSPSRTGPWTSAPRAPTTPSATAGWTSSPPTTG